jgi:hypothetical protein
MSWKERLFKPLLLKHKETEERVNSAEARIKAEISILRQRLDATHSLLQLVGDIVSLRDPAITDLLYPGKTGLATPKVKCPSCHTEYDILKSLPVGAGQATVVCANNLCAQQLEIFPHPEFGWARHIVTVRERS